MKARVKTTGEIVNVTQIGTKCYLYDLNNVEILDEPDYWEKLKHQAAIAAMQGLLSNSSYMGNFVKYSVKGDSLVSVATQNAFDYATALIEKLKNEKQ